MSGTCPGTAEEPVSKVERSAAAASKTSTRKTGDGTTVTSYRDLLSHLATKSGTPPAFRAPRRPSNCSPCPRPANSGPWTSLTSTPETTEYSQTEPRAPGSPTIRGSWRSVSRNFSRVPNGVGRALVAVARGGCVTRSCIGSGRLRGVLPVEARVGDSFPGADYLCLTSIRLVGDGRDPSRGPAGVVAGFSPRWTRIRADRCQCGDSTVPVTAFHVILLRMSEACALRLSNQA